MIPKYLSAIWAATAPALGNHLWQSTLCIVIAGLLTLILRKNHARARYGLWLAASVKFLIPFSLLIGYRQPSGEATRSPTNGTGFLLCDGGSQPALHAAGGACDFSGCSLDNSSESGPSASGNPRGNVVLRIRGGPFCMVRALAADFRSPAGSGALAGRARSGSAAPRGASGRNTEADRVVVVAGFSGTGHFRHRQARPGMAERDLRAP